MAVRDLSISVARERRVLSALVVSAVLIWIDTTILGIALEPIADPVAGLGATPGELQWAVGAYSLIFATALFAAGALGDRYGQRTVLLTGLTTFAAASLWAAWAPSATQLVLARGLMGLGGAMIMPTSMAIIGATFPPERRAGAIAVWTASSGLGVALGPLLGGVLVDNFWWGSVFLINIPIVVLALAGISRYAPNPRAAQRRRLDTAGLVLSTSGLAALAYGLIAGGQDADWARAEIWLPVLAGLALLTAFVVVEWRSAEPSFDPRLFRDRRFAAGNLALGALFFGMTGQMFYGNFYLQGARGLTALDTGLLFLPSALGVVAGSVLGARLTRRYGVAAVAGTALFVVGCSFLANLTFALDTSLLWFATLGAVTGTAIGAAIAPTVAAVLAVLPMDRMGAGSAVNNTIRQVGSVLGIAVLGTVLSVTYRDRIAPALDGLAPAARAAAGTSAEQARHLAVTLGRPGLGTSADNAFIDAMHVTAVGAGGVALVAAVLLAVAFRAGREREQDGADTTTAGSPAAAARPEPATEPA